VTVEDARRFLAEAAAEFYGYPSDRLKVIGITGTNGKTTISYLIEAIAKKSGRLAE
jgi:UDP-N-acetylmuramoyl-L-alanyl-D-glutamate--2,6-diaminopimelate ligase